MHALKRLLIFPFTDEFVVFFHDFRKMSFDKVPQGAVVHTESPCQRFYSFGRRAVQAYRLSVFLHAMTGHHLAIAAPARALSGIA